MTVRRPLKTDGTAGLKEMTAQEVLDISLHAAYLYATDIPVTLTRVSSGGNLGNISDTRKEAGAASISTGGAWPASQSFAPESSTAEPGTVTVQYGHVEQTLTHNGDPTSGQYPCYYDPVTGITEMTPTDFADTILAPAIDQLVTASGASAVQNGTYFVSTSTSVANATLVSADIIFKDTRADPSLYSAAGIPETLDQPQTITAGYYLHRHDITTVGYAHICPVFIDTTMGANAGGVATYTRPALETLLINNMKWFTTQVVGYKLSYNWSGSGQSRGSMVDTILNGSGNYQQYQANANDYRAQEFPNGSPVTNQTHTLKILRS